MMVLVIVMIMQVMMVVDGKQSWLKQPGYAEVNPGESVVLDCHIANKEGDCRWKWNTLMIITYPLDKWRKSCNLVMAKVTPKLPNFENHFDKVPHYGILTSFFAIYQKVFFFFLLHSGRKLFETCWWCCPLQMGEAGRACWHVARQVRVARRQICWRLFLAHHGCRDGVRWWHLAM